MIPFIETNYIPGTLQTVLLILAASQGRNYGLRFNKKTEAEILGNLLRVILMVHGKVRFRLRSDSRACGLLLSQCHLLKADKKEEKGDIEGCQSQCLRLFTHSSIHSFNKYFTYAMWEVPGDSKMNEI